MSDIAGAHILITPPGALYETPPFVRNWRMRGPAGPTPSSQAGAVSWDDDVITGADVPPSEPGGQVVHQPVALAGAVT